MMLRERMLFWLLLASLPCILSQNILEGTVFNATQGIKYMDVSPDKSEMVLVSNTKVYIVRKIGNRFNETFQAISEQPNPVHADYSQNGNQLFVVYKNSIGIFFQRGNDNKFTLDARFNSTSQNPEFTEESTAGSISAFLSSLLINSGRHLFLYGIYPF